MGEITSRADDILVTSDGRYMPPAGMTIAFRPIPSIIESQLIQEDRHRVVVKVVRGAQYSDADSKALVKNLHARLGHEMKIELQFVDHIPRTGEGKYRWIISKVPLDV
jgi:phenylacetate-CoA ligase